MKQNITKSPSIIYTTFFFLILLISSCSSSSFTAGKVIAASTEPTEISFETHKELILIEATINGQKGLFLFDNGFSMSALNLEFAEKANVKFKGGTTLRDANNRTAKRGKATVDKVEIGGHSFVGTGFYEIDTDLFFPCKPIDGVIGASIINKINWQVDFEKYSMQISSKAFQEEGWKTDIYFSTNNSSFVNLTIHDKTYNCKIDLGKSGHVELDRSIHPTLFKGDLADKRTGILALSALGLGKLDTSYYLSEEQDLAFKNQLLPIKTTIEMSRGLKYEGYIGTKYFNDYLLTINSSEKQYILSNPVEQEKIKKSYGIRLYLIEGEWKIIQMNQNDPLFEGVELMSVVETLDNEPISRFKNLCEYGIYLDEKIDREEALILGLKKGNQSIEVPFKEPVLARY